MEKNKDCGKESTSTTTTRYTKEFAWEIENFGDWWSSREVAKSNRNEDTTWLEDMDHEKPQEWTKSSTSPSMTFEIEGVVHEFKLAILKYDSWDRFDDEHCTMMGISLLYNGPSESIIVKPKFYLRNSGKEYGYTIKARTLRKGRYSEARIFSGHGLESNEEQFVRENFIVMCLAQINVVKDCSEISRLENKLASKRTWAERLSDGFACSTKGGDLEQFSDFEILCVDKTDSGDELETHFRCHRLVLFLSSRYFKQMFSGSFSQSQGTTKVTDVSSVTMSKLLNYIYTGNLSTSEINIELLNASDKYQIEPLHALCELELGAKVRKVETSP